MKVITRLVNDNCKYCRRYRYRYFLLKVSTDDTDIDTFAKSIGDTFIATDTFMHLHRRRRQIIESYPSSLVRC